MRLRTRLNLQVVFVVTIVVAALGSYTHHREKNRLLQSMERQTEDATGRLAVSLPGPLWNFELQFAVDSIESELRSEWLRAVVVLDKNGKLILARTKGVDGATSESRHAPAPGDYQIDRELKFEDSSVGQVQVFADDSSIRNQLRELFWFTVLQILMLDFAIFLVLALVVSRTVIRPLEIINRTVSAIAEGRFDNQISVDSDDELGQLLQNLDKTQNTLQENVEREHAVAAEQARIAEQSARIAAENARIAAGLQVCQANVMIANNDLEIIYMNDTVMQMMTRNEKQLRKALPRFRASELVGTCVDVFHENPAHQRKIIRELQAPFKTELKIAGLTLSLNASPVHNEQGERLGTVVEWTDKTAELAREAAEKALAAENARIAAGLQVCQANVMIANNDLEIIYMNDTVSQMMAANEAKLQNALPDFSASDLVGTCVDRFHENPAHQRKIISELTEPYAAALKIAGLTFQLNASPVYDDRGERLGTVVEWHDRTEELARAAAEQAIAAENARIAAGLKVCRANVMIANNDMEIIYVNDAVRQMMQNNETDLRSVLPNLRASELVGTCVDEFHRNPSHQRDLIKQLQQPYATQLKLAGLTFGLTASPVYDDLGERLGTVVEWEDQTAELARQEAERTAAEENRRIRQALDSVSTSAMIADADLRIIYLNKAAFGMMRNAEEDIRRDLDSFSVDDLIGANIDQFHKEPTHQRNLLAGMRGAHHSEIMIGGRSFALVANPITNDEGHRIGTVVEWNDRTNEVAIEKEIDNIVQNAASGNLDGRIALEGRNGFFQSLGRGLNELVDVCQNVIDDMLRVFGALARGDLTETVAADYQGQFGKLKEDANSTVANLTEVMGKINIAAGSVSTAANEMAQGNADLSQRTEEQASALEETASSMQEMTATVGHSAENARTANEMADEARNRAARGGSVVNQAVESMASINESSKKIADIIGVIDEIAFQTNLLALNAAVEAARAGEQGRGFAVVAGEVRNLAQRSAAAAKEIKDLIRDSENKVKQGSQFVNESGETLQEIVASVEQVGATIAEIAAAASEQRQGIEQVNLSISQMDEMTQQNAALVEQASASSESMAEQAREMSNLVSFFKMTNGQ